MLISQGARPEAPAHVARGLAAPLPETVYCCAGRFEKKRKRRRSITRGGAASRAPALLVLANKITCATPNAKGVRYYKRIKKGGRPGGGGLPTGRRGCGGSSRIKKRGEAQAVPSPAAWRPEINTPNPIFAWFVVTLQSGSGFVKEGGVPIIRYAVGGHRGGSFWGEDGLYDIRVAGETARVGMRNGTRRPSASSAFSGYSEKDKRSILTRARYVFRRFLSDLLDKGFWLRCNIDWLVPTR